MQELLESPHYALELAQLMDLLPKNLDKVSGSDEVFQWGLSCTWMHVGVVVMCTQGLYMSPMSPMKKVGDALFYKGRHSIVKLSQPSVRLNLSWAQMCANLAIRQNKKGKDPARKVALLVESIILLRNTLSCLPALADSMAWVESALLQVRRPAGSGDT
jgi:hypothetical protein